MSAIGPIALDDSATQMPTKPPFRCEDSERTIAGTALLHPETTAEFVGLGLLPELFGRYAYAVIWRAIASLWAATDFMSARQWLAERGQLDEVGGAAKIAGLVDGLPPPPAAEESASPRRSGDADSAPSPARRGAGLGSA